MTIPLLHLLCFDANLSLSHNRVWDVKRLLRCERCAYTTPAKLLIISSFMRYCVFQCVMISSTRPGLINRQTILQSARTTWDLKISASELARPYPYWGSSSAYRPLSTLFCFNTPLALLRTDAHFPHLTSRQFQFHSVFELKIPHKHLQWIMLSCL